MSADRVGRTWGRVVAVSALPLLSWPSVTGSLRSKRTHPIGSKADELQPGRSQLLVRDAELGIPGDLPEVAVGVAGSPVGIIAHSWNACLQHGQPPLAAKPSCGAYWEQCRERASWSATRSCTSPLTSLLSAENAAKLNALNTHAHPRAGLTLYHEPLRSESSIRVNPPPVARGLAPRGRISLLFSRGLP